MPDPTTVASAGVIALAASHALRDSISRLLGPTADYLGQELKDLTATQIANLRHIFTAAARDVKTNEEGYINPRLLRAVLEDGPYCADELLAEYYGGLLASSRDHNGKDDSGTYYASILQRLSSEQIKSHWILYSILFSYFYDNSDINVYKKAGRDSATILIPWRSFLFMFSCFDEHDWSEKYELNIKRGRPPERYFEVNESLERAFDTFRYNVKLRIEAWEFEDFIPGMSSPRDLLRRLDVALHGLLKEGLVEKMYWGSRVRFEDNHRLRYKSGVVFSPSVIGLDLFLRAQAIPPEELLNQAFQCLLLEFRPSSFHEKVMEGVLAVRAEDREDQTILSPRSAERSQS